MFILGCILTVKYQFLPSFDVLWRTGTELYIAPWMRITPYCVGVICGWTLKKYRKTFSVSDVREKRNFPDLVNTKLIKFFFSFCIKASAELFVLHFDVFNGSCASQYNLSRHGSNFSVNLYNYWTATDCNWSQHIHHYECVWI
jgi:hypothetical protein